MAKENIKPVSFKEFFQVLLWSFRTAFAIDPLLFVGWFISKTFNDLEPLVYAYLFGYLVDLSVKAITQQNVNLEDFKFFFIFFIIEAFASSATRAIYRFSSYVIRQKTRKFMLRKFYRQMNFLGVQTMEDPQVNNQISLAEDSLYEISTLITESINFVSRFIAVVTTGVTVVIFSPILIFVVICFTIVKFIPTRYFVKKYFQLDVETTEKNRIASQSALILKNPVRLPEISVIGAFAYFDKMYSDFIDWYTKKRQKLQFWDEISGITLDLVSSLISIFGYLFIISNLLLRKISAGTVTFQFRALNLFINYNDSLLGSVTVMLEVSSRLKHVKDFFELKRVFKDGHIELPRFKHPPALHLKNLTFKYPKANKTIFEDLNLEIKSGEKVAIVGHNGAGKTTLVKLLARLYNPEDGAIFVNNTNLNDLKIDDWYKNIGILFQDYNIYGNLSVKNNVYMGRPLKPIDEKAVKQALINADAMEFVEKFEHGIDELLDEKFEGGTRPSTGQQQKIAIARFFYRDASLVVFDEPTSAIDAVSEYNIFNKIYSFFKNKTVIIISHRFSTVRNADRIIVMDQGKVAEQGTHEELLKKDGIYAHAFKLQAEGYK